MFFLRHSVLKANVKNKTTLSDRSQDQDYSQLTVRNSMYVLQEKVKQCSSYQQHISTLYV